MCVINMRSKLVRCAEHRAYHQGYAMFISSRPIVAVLAALVMSGLFVLFDFLLSYVAH